MGSAKSSKESLIRKVTHELAGEMMRAWGTSGDGVVNTAHVVAIEAIMGGLSMERDRLQIMSALRGPLGSIAVTPLRAWIDRAKEIERLLKKNWSHFDDGPAKSAPVAGSRRAAKTLASAVSGPKRVVAANDVAHDDEWTDWKLSTEGDDFKLHYRYADEDKLRAILNKAQDAKWPLRKVEEALAKYGARFVPWGNRTPGHNNTFGKG